MKIKEFIEKVNEHDGMRAKKVDKKIVIGTPNNMGILSIPEDATNFIEIDTWATSNSLYWKKADREYLSALIEEFLHTPIEKRKSGKRYLLFWDNDGDGTSNCLAKGNDGWGIVKIDKLVPGKLGPKSCEFTEFELDQIKQDVPWLSEAIDSMKVPVPAKEGD